MKVFILFLALICSIFIGKLFAQEQKNVVLLDHWTDTTITPGLEDAIFNDLWGFTQNGQDYCVIGSNIGSHFFQIDQDQLTLIGFEPGKFQSPYVEHRDFKTYDHYLYGVCDEGTSSLQIFDTQFLPDSIVKVYDSDLHFQIAHNLYIDTAKAKMYVSGPNNLGMQIFDLTNPSSPELLDYFTDLDYVHDCYVRNDTAFLNAGFDGLHVYDFSGMSPVQLGILDFYPNQGYNHSGWWSPNGEHYAFIDETQGTRIRMCEWGESLGDIQVGERFATRDFEDYVPHNIILLDHLAFVAYYNEGLRIFDINQAPYQEIGTYDTFTDETDYRLNGAWGVFIFEKNNQVLISDRQNGLFLFSFPIQELNQDRSETYLSQTPFITNDGYLIPRESLDEQSLSFSIYTSTGKTVYHQANYLNYLKIPLTLSAGVYHYVIYNQFDERIESGTFVRIR
jgi:choice-of-anchor B domain-containing protein